MKKILVAVVIIGIIGTAIYFNKWDLVLSFGGLVFSLIGQAAFGPKNKHDWF